MENKKFEQLIDLIINEQEDKARELFHEIVVEKSREIYESIMDEEMIGEGDMDAMDSGMEEGDEMVGEVGQLMDEISAEESGVAEAEDDAELDADISVDDEDGGEDFEMDADAEESGDKPETVDDVKDKFEELLADFERILSGGEEGAEDDMSEEMMEAVQLQKVSVTHGDNGAQTKSPALHEPKIKAEGVKPVKFSGDSETVPTGPKGPSNEYSKKEGTLIGDVGNTPGQKKGQQLKPAPKAVTKDGAADKHSPVAKG